MPRVDAVEAARSERWPWANQSGGSDPAPSQQHPHGLPWALIENADTDLDQELWLWDPKQRAS